MIFYLRIFWFPFIVLNYAAGATRIRFRDYFLGTLLGLLPPVFIFTYFVGAMRDVLATYRKPADLLTFDLLFPILLLAFSFFLPATPFTIAGAVIFGKFHGMLYNLAADTLGASISFYLGRYFLHGVARGFLETRMPWLDRKAAEE